MDNPRIIVAAIQERHLHLFYFALYNRFNVLRLDNSRSLMQILSENNIRFILLSDQLQDAPGIQVLKKIKRKYPSVPVVMFCEKPSSEYILEVFHAGARDFLVLPAAEKKIIQVSNAMMSCREKGAHLPVTVRPSAMDKMKFPFDNLLTHFDKTVRQWKRMFRFNKSEPSLLRERKSDLAKTVQPTNSIRPVKTACNSQRAHTQMDVYFLNDFLVKVGGQVLHHCRGKKCKELFAYLLLHHKKHIYRDILIDLFWPRATPDAGRNCLNVTLHNIRQMLDVYEPSRNFIQFRDDCYYLNPQYDIILDSERFRKLYSEGNQLESAGRTEDALAAYEKAKAIYRADFLEEFLYERWTVAERENLKEIYLYILDKISKYYSLDGNPAGALNICLSILHKDNCREDIHRRLMICYTRMGKRDLAIRQFYKCKQILQTEFGVLPMKKTIALFEQISRDSNVRLTF